MSSLAHISSELDVFGSRRQLHAEGAACPALAIRAVARIGIEADTLCENVAYRSAWAAATEPRDHRVALRCQHRISPLKFQAGASRCSHYADPNHTCRFGFNAEID